MSLHAQGQYDNPIQKWLAAADWLAQIVSIDSTLTKRAIALAFEATTDALCIQRCVGSVPVKAKQGVKKRT